MVINETRARPMTLDQEEVFIYSELSRLKHELCDHLASVGVLRLGFAARDAELSRLRAVNAELVEAMHRIANTCENFDGCPVGPQTIAEVAHAALSRAERAKPEPESVLDKILEAESEWQKIEQAGKSEGRQG